MIKECFKRLRLVLLVAGLSLVSSKMSGQIQVTTEEFTGLIQSKSFGTIGVHDPSIFFDDKSQTYYIYGTHYSGAKTKDLRNWTRVSNYFNTSQATAFSKSPIRKVFRCLPGQTGKTEVTLPSYDAKAFCSIYGDANTWINGNMWAPDIIYNPNMGKYCLYLSLNGDHWASVIVLMTADKVEGPYTYQGPILFGGFNNQTYNNKKVDYKQTDLEVVLGPLSDIPSRYKTDRWGSYYPNCIDPCVLFDEEGELWMTYGSWSGGIFALKLDKNTGFRDYTYIYPGISTSPEANASSDAYFGKKIAGGHYVSGEGSYVQKIGNYYFLFMTYGGLESNKGYEMRVFRSDKLTGPYKDANNQLATYTGYQLNYGPHATTNRGMKLIGSMNKWGNMKVTECAQGHNSATVDKEGRSFLFFHTRFNNGNEGFQVRSYQMYLNQSGWLCTAPFQYFGETTTDADIASSQPFSVKDVIGDYHIIVHPYKLDHENYAAATPKLVTLTEDGKVTGDYTGTWKYTEEGKSYISLTLKGVNGVSSSVFDGVVVEQTMENTTVKTICFTTVCSTAGNANVGVPCWGYKWHPKYSLALNYDNLKSTAFKATALASVSKNTQILYDTEENAVLSWTSTNPDVFSNTGKYNPDTVDVSMTMTAKLECGNYFWQKDFICRARKAAEVAGDPFTGLVAYYNFDENPTLNLYDETQKALYGTANSTLGVKPAIENDYARFGSVVHQYNGEQGKNSYTRMPNPLAETDIDGFTVSLWVKRTDANTLGALWSFFNSSIASAKGPKFFLTGNCYLHFDDNDTNWFDVNNPETKVVDRMKVGEWHLVTFTFSRTDGYKLYIDGTALTSLNMKYAGSAASIAEFDKNIVFDVVKQNKYFYLGLGANDGSADACFDDLMIYNRALTAEDISGLNTLLNRVNDFSPEAALSVEQIPSSESTLSAPSKAGIYDLYGRKVSLPLHGIYIMNGKKIFVK